MNTNIQRYIRGPVMIYKCYKLLASVVECSFYWTNICCLLSDPLTSAPPWQLLFPRLCTGAHLLIQTVVPADGLFNLLTGQQCHILTAVLAFLYQQRKTLLEPDVQGEKFDAHIISCFYSFLDLSIQSFFVIMSCVLSDVLLQRMKMESQYTVCLL